MGFASQRLVAEIEVRPRVIFASLRGERQKSKNMTQVKVRMSHEGDTTFEARHKIRATTEEK
jgi:hypothetical protein